MCPDMHRHEDPTACSATSITGHPSRPAWFGWTCNLVASLLGLQLHPNHADGLLRPSQERREVSPMCPVRSVTHVPGCTLLSLGVCSQLLVLHVDLGALGEERRRQGLVRHWGVSRCVSTGQGSSRAQGVLFKLGGSEPGSTYHEVPNALVWLRERNA